jgi:hypothetical protein
MVDDEKEVEKRKKAIFDGMSKRGQERILRMGYDKWNPFQEPKDPRERLFSPVSMNAHALLKEFYQANPQVGPSEVVQKELFELCVGLMRGETRAEIILDFCSFYKQRVGSKPLIT